MNSHDGEGRPRKLDPDLPLPLPLSWNDLDNDDEDDDDGDGDDDEASYSMQNCSRLLWKLQKRQRTSTSTTDWAGSVTFSLERLPPDVSAVIFTHLTVQEIATASEASTGLYVASRNPDLWQAKFVARWNYNDPTIHDWYLAYQQSYWNPQDLWITHWNCTDPSDGLGPGRCCIQDKNDNNYRNNKKSNTSGTKATKIGNKHTHSHLCPNCRYHPKLTRPSSCRVDASIDKEENVESTRTTTISTLAQAIQTATDLRLEECRPHPDDGDHEGRGNDDQLLPATQYSARRAERAFAKSSTFHRKIDTHQYRDHSLCFLQDLLFFQTHDVHDAGADDEPVEIRDWKQHMKQSRQVQEGGAFVHHTHHQESDGYEPSLHSWHLAKFSNPDHNCPIVWRISIQRPDCFTVFPSEGLLQPGESKVIVFGVKPLASVLAYATHQLNVHRESVDEFWAKLYSEEAHLPFAPFLVHYHYASVVPCRRADDDARPSSSRSQSSHLPRHPNPNWNPNMRAIQLQRQRQQHPNSNSSSLLPMESPWQQSAQPQQPIRTLYLSAHVNAHYTLSEFRRKTIVPFSLPRHSSSGTRFEKGPDRTSGRSWSPVLYCAPQLMEFYPNEWQRLQNLELEVPRNDSIEAQRHRTEEACQGCGLTWGPRSEELGQAYVVAKLESEEEYRRQRKRFGDIYRLLRGLVQSFQHHQKHQYSKQESLGSFGNWPCYRVVYLLHRRVMNFRGAPWLSRRNSRVLIQWEILLDNIATNLGANERENSLPWRFSGVYRHALCTDSVFDAKKTFDKNGTDDLLIDSHSVLWKEEPDYLRPFAHLAHNPGLFCLGLQEDPNHLRRSKLGSKFIRRQMGCSTDMFMDDPICGLQAAICVVSNPRSLLVHGIYDRIPYPGSVIRRPKLPVLSRLDKRRCQHYLRANYDSALTSFIRSSKQLIYYELQNSLDVESLLLVNSIFDPHSDLHSIPYSISLRNFVRNVPHLGSGRFAISMELNAETTSDENHGMTGRSEYWYLDTSISEIAEYSLTQELPEDSNATELSEGSDNDAQIHGGNHPPNDNLHVQQFAPLDHNVMLPRGPRVLNLLWVLSAHLGWTVDDNQGAASVYVDRRILIGAQWLSLSLMTAPLLWSLCARYAQWIPSAPVDYKLEALPFHVENKLRFLTETECGYFALILLSLYLILGRRVERTTSRDFVRAMLEHMPIDNGYSRRMFGNLYVRVLRWLQRRWDEMCPLFLQRLVFVPLWNRRNSEALTKHIVFWRSQDSREHTSVFRALSGRGRIFYEARDRSIQLGDESIVTKVLIGTIVCLGSFSASSPHFFLNVLTVFSSSISLGLSMSLQSMETGRAGVIAGTTGSVIRALSLVTVVILGFLVGQLVGSSGGVLFLAEFIVTSVSLVLGGAGTISASAMESWFTFFCFASTAFIGYLLGRVAVMEGIRQKRSGFSSIMLCASIVAIIIFWMVAAVGWEWETAVQLAVIRPRWMKDGRGVISVHDARNLP